MWSQTPSISAAGSIIAFESLATDLVSGQNDSNNRCDMWSCRGSDVFLYDTSSCEVTLVSHVPGAQAVTSEMPSRDPILSADSRYVTFQSPSTDLVVGQLDSNGTDDVFVFDRMNGEVTLASHVPGSPVTAGDKESFLGTLSGNGNAVSFSSRATNLVGGQVDSNGVSDVFLLRRDTGVMSLVSHVPGAQTVTGHGESGPGFLSPDGSVVVFVSTADDLAPLDFNTTLDLFAFAAPSPGRRPRRVIGH
jgi:Tol biopolymer transport system component